MDSPTSKKSSSSSSKASRPGPSPSAAKRLENIETIRGGAKLDPVVSPHTPPPTIPEVVSSVSTIHDVTQVMGLANINAEDLWEGKTDLFPIILHYGQELLAAAMANEEECALELKLPATPEFNGVAHKLYRCDPFWTVHHTVNMVCKRFNIADTKPYCLATNSGFVLQDSEPLATFGLGSLLPRWQLVLQLRAGRTITRMDTIKQFNAQSERPSVLATFDKADSKASLKKKATSRKAAATANSDERFPLLLVLDTAAFKYKSQRVQIRGGSTIQELLDAVARAHSLPSSTTSTLAVSTLAGVTLDRTGVFSEYGLGKRFQRWQLRVHTASGDAIPLKSISKYAWTQIDEANLQPIEAKQLILELDKKVERYRRQAVKQESGKDSVAAKTLTKLEAELVRTKEAKADAEKAHADAELRLENETAAFLKQKADLEATIARLRTERDEHKSRNKDLEKQIADDKSFFEAQLDQSKKTLGETLHRFTMGAGPSSKSRKSVAGAFEPVSSSKSTSDVLSSPKQIDESLAALAQAQAEVVVAQGDLVMLKKEMEHQKATLEATIASLKGDSERAKKESEKLAGQLAGVNGESAQLKFDFTALQAKVQNLINSLEVEKASRRDAVQKIVELEQQLALADDARSETLISRIEAEYEARYADLLATNRELYSGVEEMRKQLIEAGRERDEIQTLLDQAQEQLQRAPASTPSSSKDSTTSSAATGTTPRSTVGISSSAPPPPAPPAPGATSKTSSGRSKPKRQDSVFLGLSLASRIEQGRNNLKTSAATSEKKTYSSDLEAALHRRFLAMSSDLDIEELSDGDDTDDGFDDDSLSTTSSGPTGASRALFDLKL